MEGVNLTPTMQNALSQLDPIGLTGICAREIRILSSSNRWLTDDIISSVIDKYLGVGEASKVFSPSLRDPENPLIVIINTNVLFKAVLNYLIEDITKGGRKKTYHTMSEVPHDILHEGYAHSNFLWEHKNIFSLPRSWFFSIINYPDNKHWMFIGMQAETACFFIYDPMQDKGQIARVRSAVLVYIDLEARDHADKIGVDISSLRQSSTWTEKKYDGPQQYDTVNCGVLTLIAFFRAISFVANGLCTPEQVTKRWTAAVIPKAFERYRQQILNLLINVMEEGDGIEDRRKEPPSRPSQGRRYAGFRYFEYTLLVYLQGVYGQTNY
jgi:hypothetical protein